MAREIKRYRNRKLYDTERSSYIRLQDICDLVRQGEPFTVLDNDSGTDLTVYTLAMAIQDVVYRGNLAEISKEAIMPLLCDVLKKLPARPPKEEEARPAAVSGL